MQIYKCFGKENARAHAKPSVFKEGKSVSEIIYYFKNLGALIDI
jgi:hypothetical protein